MKLVAGSYERFLWGWKMKEKPASLQCAFSYPAHMGPVRCIAGCGSVVATGGADDTIRVFDINTMSDKGSLVKHDGAVTCLAFYGTAASESSSRIHPTHLLSGSEDGRICIWDTDAWIHLKTLTGGKKTSINDISVHPSGRIALSVEHDVHLRMWNLMKGRCSFSAKLQSEASLVQFSSGDGGVYCLARGSVVEICNAENGGIIQSLQHEKRVLCMGLFKESLVVTGGEGCSVDAWDVRTGKIGFSVSKAHASRIKGIALVGGSQNSQPDEFPQLIASASSDGLVRVWDTRIIRSADLGNASEPLTESGTKSRLTCLISCGNLRKKALPSSEIGEDAAAASEAAGWHKQAIPSAKSSGSIRPGPKGVRDDQTTLVLRREGKRSIIRSSGVLKQSSTKRRKAKAGL